MSQVVKNKLAEEIIAAPFVDTYRPKHQEGPDYIIPTEDTRTWVADGAVKIKIRTSGTAPWKPQSVVTLLRQTVDKYPSHLALAVKREGKWVEWSYEKYWCDVCTAAKGFIKLGLKPFSGVGILGYNAPEWFISSLAAIFAGGFCVGIYTTNSPEACIHALKDSASTVLVVENDTQLKKILPNLEQLPKLKAIVQYTGQPSDPRVLSWNELLVIGRSVSDEILGSRIKGLAVNQCCCLIYTSGTTGNAKGVMLSHDNITFFVKYASFKVWKFKMAEEVRISYLPLSHVAALNGDLFGTIVVAASVYFAPPDALKGKMVDTLREVQPTALVGVPRVWEKMCEKIRESESSLSLPKSRLMLWARRKVFKQNMKQISGETSTEEIPWSCYLAEKLILRKIRRLLGLQRTAVMICGGAPMTNDVLRYFLSLNMKITECYGLSETAGPHAIHLNDDFRLGSVGRVLPEYEVSVEATDDDGTGEILMRGRNIFMGYLHEEEKTMDSLDDDGWMHTGDIGYLDADNFLFVTGRIKEIIITSGGENVAPVPIEDSIKEYLPITSNCMLVGDQRKFLTMLLTVKTEVDMDTLVPLDKLALPAEKWCLSIKSTAKTVGDILQGPDLKVMTAIQEGIDMYNKRAISNAQRIQKWVILPQDFSIPGGELGPSLKLKRQFALKKYHDVIEAMYCD